MTFSILLKAGVHSYDENDHMPKQFVFVYLFLCPRHSKNGGGALSVTPVRACVRACVRPSVRYQNLVSAQ